MIEIKVRYSQSDLDTLTAEATALGVPRAQLIRDRSLSRGVARLPVVEYHSLVAGAVAFMRGDMARIHVETLAAYVIARLDKYSRQTITSDHPAP
jgi:hypothetical protein